MMSVAKSEPKTPRKSSRNSADTQKTALSALLAQTEEVHIPLSSLVKSPLNVRTVPYSAESVRELADSVQGVGLLQNLVVHALPEGGYGVAAGGRRLAALTLLAERGSIPAEWPVRVKIVPQELATAASLTENGNRKDMHPAEQITGFRTLAAEGKTPAQIGGLLGYSGQHVRRMLKLAGLAPVILEALAGDKITTEHCQALALEDDTARQVQVYEAACQAGWNGIPQVQAIRNMITESEVPVKDNPRFRFVGADAFSPDELRCDLFSDTDGGYVDRLALEAALHEKLRAVAEGLKAAEGWAWCDVRPVPLCHYGEDAEIYRLLPEPEGVLTDGEQQYIRELAAGDASADSQAEIRLTECMAKVRAWTPEVRAESGVVVSWCYGGVSVQRGVQLREKEAGDSAEDDVSLLPGEKIPDPAGDISGILLTKSTSERTLAVQAALIQHPDKARVLLIWTLCLSVFDKCAYHSPAQISLTCDHHRLTDNAPSGQGGRAYQALMREESRLESLLPEGWRRDMSLFFTLGEEVLSALLCYCTAASLNGVQSRTGGHTPASLLDTLETAIGFHLRDWWRPTKENFFGHLKKPQIIDALYGAGLPGAAREAENMKKGDAAGHAEACMKENRWVPAWLKGQEQAPDSGSTGDNGDTGTAQAA